MAEGGFFETREKLIPPRRPRPAKPIAATASSTASSNNIGNPPLSVSQLTRIVDQAVRSGVPGLLAVQGEISNYSLNRGSGHAYFTLKDAQACLNCVMFRTDFEKLKFKPADGMEALATGSVKVFAAQGKYQLYAATLSPVGQGALELAFNQLREKLAAAGLLDPTRKRPIPRYPQRVAILTSRETAAIGDMLKVLQAFPCISIVHCHVPVQGEESARRIIAALAYVNRYRELLGNPEVILLGRGGGSMEDLWCFNDESLARAIADSAIPVITGIGHDCDTTIADMVADHHAHTPTRAAEIVVQHWKNAADLIDHQAVRLQRETGNLLRQSQQRLRSIALHEFFRRPVDLVDLLRQKLDDRQQNLQLALHRLLRARQSQLQRQSDRLQQNTPAALIARALARCQRLWQRLEQTLSRQMRSRQDRLQQHSTRLAEHHPRMQVALRQSQLLTLHDRLRRSIQIGLSQQRLKLDATERQLEALSPQRVLERGYTVTTLARSGKVVRSAADLAAHDRIVTRFQDGTVESKVTDSAQPELFE